MYLTNILWLVFAAAVLVFILLSAVLVYHWRAYAMNKKVIHRVEALYFTVSAIIIIAAGISILFA